MAQTPPTFARPVKQAVYDVNSMSWVPMEQPVVSADTLAVTIGGPLTVTGPLTDAQLRATAVPVSGPLTDTQLRAAGVPTLHGLNLPPHDYISLTYTGDNLTTVVFKTGGAAGSTVATLTLAYSGSTLTSVTKS